MGEHGSGGGGGRPGTGVACRSARGGARHLEHATEPLVSRQLAAKLAMRQQLEQVAKEVAVARLDAARAQHERAVEALGHGAAHGLRRPFGASCCSRKEVTRKLYYFVVVV